MCILKNIKLISFLVVAFFLSSCLTDEGPGGKSVIEGKVYKVFHLNDVYNFKTDTFPAAKEDVYIVYGNEPVYGDKMETGYDGTFRFRFLTPGTYKVYAYSTVANTQKIAVIDTLTVGYDQTARTKDIYIHEGKSYNTSYITGTVLAKYYNNKGVALTALMPAYDIRVFIKEKGAAYHFEEIRTGLDGAFMFQNLKVGEYEVFVLTEDTFTEALSPVIQTIKITSPGEIYTFPTPFEIIVVV